MVESRGEGNCLERWESLGSELRFCPIPHKEKGTYRGVPGDVRRSRSSRLASTSVLAPRFYIKLSLQLLPKEGDRRHQGEALTIRAPATRPCPRRRPSVVTEGF